jgi:hypothetical protein
MCTIIIAADKLKDQEKFRFNWCSPDWKEGMEDWSEDDIDGFLTEEKMCVLDKICPCELTCEFDGKTVPCFVGWTPKGWITGALLAEILNKMDGLELFYCSHGIGPLRFLEGHGSHFELHVVEYIHEDRGCAVFIGVPYGTKMVSSSINPKKARRDYL